MASLDLPQKIIDDILRDVIKSLVAQIGERIMIEPKGGFACGGTIRVDSAEDLWSHQADAYAYAARRANPRAPKDIDGWLNGTFNEPVSHPMCQSSYSPDANVPLGDRKCGIQVIDCKGVFDGAGEELTMEDLAVGYMGRPSGYPNDVHGGEDEGTEAEWINHGMTNEKRHAAVTRTETEYLPYLDGERISFAEFEEMVGETPSDFYLTRVKPAIPRKADNIADIMHLMPLCIYYDDTGEEVPDVVAYDLDAGYCWQHVMDDNGRPVFEGKNIKMRRLNGSFTVSKPR